MNAPVNLEVLLNPDADSDEKKKETKPVAIKSATHFVKRGNTFAPVDAASLVVIETLPVGTYTVGATPAGFHFEQIDNFELPQKVYGDTIKNADRILATFADRPNATGVLLEGEKGSGKSMLLKEISIMGRALGMPTIVINSPTAVTPSTPSFRTSSSRPLSPSTSSRRSMTATTRSAC